MTVQTDYFLIDTGAATDTGCVRDHNEDSYLTKPEFGVWVVADGMGGHVAGEVASNIAASTAFAAIKSQLIPSRLDTNSIPAAINAAINTANAATKYLSIFVRIRIEAKGIRKNRLSVIASR